MAWLELSFVLESRWAQVCSEQLETLGALAVSFFDAGNNPLFEPPPNSTPLWDKVKIVGLFTEEINATDIVRTLQASFPTLCCQVTHLADRDWTRTWLAHFRPLQFGDKLWVAPSEYPDWQAPQGAIILHLDPGLAFGTGTHPTTALCLQWLAQHPPLQQQVIDYGCGSGILGIAALLLGATRVWAVDHDPQALLSTQQNAQRNQVAERINPLLPEDWAQQNERGHLILANILAQPLIELAPQLRQFCLPGGQIVLSGLLTTQLSAVQQAYQPDFVFEVPHIQEEWVLLVGKRVS